MPLFTLSATKLFMKISNPQNSRYCKHTVEIKELAHCENPMYFILCERSYHHNHVNVDALAADTANVDDDTMALYLGYYD